MKHLSACLLAATCILPGCAEGGQNDLGRVQGAHLALNAEEARVAAQEEVLDKVAVSYGRYASLRDLYLNGNAGFQTRASAWFGKTADWFGGWEQTLRLLEGTQLTSPAARDRATENLRSQAEELNRLIVEQETLVGQGAQILRQLNEIERVNARAFPEYEAQVGALNNQINALTNDTVTSVALFSEKFGDELEDILSVMTELVDSKIAMLRLDFPELEAVLAEIRDTLASIETVDRIVSRIADLDAEIAGHFAAGRVYTAQSLLETLSDEAQKASAELRAANVSDSAKQLGQARVGNLVASRMRQFQADTDFNSLAGRFATYYRSEMQSVPNGLVARCKASVPPTDIDCGLVRSIDGFRTSTMRRMEDDDLAYMESVLERAKRGPLSLAAESPKGAPR